MRSRYFITILLSLSLCPPLASAQNEHPAPELEPLEGPALVKAFDGKTMDGIYKIARERSGTHKFTESFNSDGTTDYFEGPLVDTGRWIVRGPLLCFAYDGALSGGVSCFNVYQSGTCIYAYNPANIDDNNFPIHDNLWSVKIITRGDISTCDDLTS